MVPRILYPVLFVALLACGGTEESQPSKAAQPVTEEGEPADSLKQNNSDFVRLHTSLGQTIYVPVYSHIYQLNQQKTFNLTATLSIRNADLNRTLILTKVLYYDSQGDIVKNYLDEPMTISPLASTSFVVEENDLRGGVGANFIVGWESENPTFPPIVEAVMISTSQQQGISFVSHGRVIEDGNPQPGSN
ncbi:MAG TPA: DUF3124 domain-containing protein [Halalkalibaculum sp.]|nr:DUF3124 domain-containing protein [Halalkalibaculum sp.]